MVVNLFSFALEKWPKVWTNTGPMSYFAFMANDLTRPIKTNHQFVQKLKKCHYQQYY